MSEEFNVNGPDLELTRFSTIADVPIHYARPPVSTYGSIGKARTPRLDIQFLKTMDACFEELWAVYPQGKGRGIVSAGCYVEKPGSHSMGRAIDIDAVWWHYGPPIIALSYPKDRKRYLATEAILRKHIGIVLNYHYNSKHRDHWHCDDTEPVGFFPTASRVVFIQAAAIHVFGLDITHDGIWGPQTEGATKQIAEQFGGPENITLLAGWNCFLNAVAQAGFADVEPKPQPEETAATEITEDTDSDSEAD